jgi:uncharacterized protein YqgC (DUF456 family)
MSMENRPDNAASAIRFGCGALIGAVIGLGIAVPVVGLDAPMLSLLLACFAAALIGGYAAAKAGDEFWNWLGENWRWF